jgi:membrane fusion protein, copper/silver efflux system
MSINKKITIPLTILALAVIVASWLYKSGRLDKLPGFHKDDGHNHQGQAATPLYTCPMHPFIIKDKPGTCPICGMELIKKLNDAQNVAQQTPEQKQQSDKLGQISLSANQRIMANVATVVARQEQLSKEISAVGSVQYDQTRQAKVTAWIAGRLDKLNVAAVGAPVAKDRPVAEVYSPELVASQQEYLLALKSREQLKGSPIPSIAQNGEGLVASARQRLMLYGVKESQIAELEKAGKPNIRLPIYTPLSGIVIDKLVQQGQYVNVGDVLFTIADLSRVWVELDMYDNEITSVHLGQAVEIRPSAEPVKPVMGRVNFIYPFHDPKTHTVKVRVEIPNHGLMFRPDMFVSAVIKTPLPRGIVLPATAVMDTGKRQVVWVEVQPGVFEPRDVQAGERIGDKVQIVSGIKAGDKVAVSGAYLIDSESQLRGGGTQDHSQHSGGAKPEATGQPAPAKKDSLKMDDMKM